MYAEIVDALPAKLDLVRGWDLAATQNAGDWTAGPRLGRSSYGTLWIADVQRERGTPDDVEKLLVGTAKRDGPRGMQSIPQGSSWSASAAAATTHSIVLVRVSARMQHWPKPSGSTTPSSMSARSVRCQCCGIRPHTSRVSETFDARDGVDALRIARSAKPDLILLDVVLPGIEGDLSLGPLASSSAKFACGYDDRTL